MKRRRVAACLLGAALLGAAVPRIARAQGDETTAAAKLRARQAIFARDAKTRELVVSFSYRDVVDDEVRRKLQSGLGSGSKNRIMILRPLKMMMKFADSTLKIGWISVGMIFTA